MKSRPLWRVGLALIILGILYMAAEIGLDSAYMAFLLLPIYMLLEPAPPELCETFPKAKADGLPFYLFKWTAISLAGIVLAILLWFLIVGASAVQLGMTDALFKSWDMKALIANVKEYFFVILVPIMLMVLASWLTRNRHYKKLCVGVPQKAPAATNTKKQGKPNRNRQKRKRKK